MEKMGPFPSHFPFSNGNGNGWDGLKMGKKWVGIFTSKSLQMGPFLMEMGHGWDGSA